MKTHRFAAGCQVYMVDVLEFVAHMTNGAEPPLAEATPWFLQNINGIEDAMDAAFKDYVRKHWPWAGPTHDPNCPACNAAWPWCDACQSYHSPCNPTCKLKASPPTCGKCGGPRNYSLDGVLQPICYDCAFKWGTSAK